METCVDLVTHRTQGWPQKNLKTRKSTPVKAKWYCWWDSTGLRVEWCPRNQEWAQCGCLPIKQGQGGATSPTRPASWHQATSLVETMDFNFFCCGSLMKSWIINNVTTTPRSKECLNHSQYKWSAPRIPIGPLTLLLNKYKLSWVIYKIFIKTYHIKKKVLLITKAKHVPCGKFRWHWKMKTVEAPMFFLTTETSSHLSP